MVGEERFCSAELRAHHCDRIARTSTTVAPVHVERKGSSYQCMNADFAGVEGRISGMVWETCVRSVLVIEVFGKH